MLSIVKSVKHITTKYPLVRGMLSYSLIWPTSAIIQQGIAGKTFGILINTPSITLTKTFQFYRKFRLVEMCTIQFIWGTLCCTHIICLDSYINNNVATHIFSYRSNKSNYN